MNDKLSIIARQNLCARRMANDAHLEASVKDGGWSLTDFQEQVRQKCQAVAKLTTPAGNGNTISGSVWVADIIAPAHELGEEWEAVVNGADGKLYCVKFAIKGNGVELAGEPKEVMRIADYDYVGEPDDELYAEARGAVMAKRGHKLEAGAPLGNKNAAGSRGGRQYENPDWAQKQTAALASSHKADALSKGATTKDEHKAAERAHMDAHYEHLRTASALEKDWQPNSAKTHEWYAKEHGQKAFAHGDAANSAFDSGEHQKLTLAYHHDSSPANFEALKESHVRQQAAAAKMSGKSVKEFVARRGVIEASSAAGNFDSADCFAAKKKADESGAKADHEAARGKFQLVADQFKAAGNEKMANFHQDYANEHRQKAIDACDVSASGKFSLDCSNPEANNLRTHIE